MCLPQGQQPRLCNATNPHRLNQEFLSSKHRVSRYHFNFNSHITMHVLLCQCLHINDNNKTPEDQKISRRMIHQMISHSKQEKSSKHHFEKNIRNAAHWESKITTVDQAVKGIKRKCQNQNAGGLLIQKTSVYNRNQLLCFLDQGVNCRQVN